MCNSHAMQADLIGTAEACRVLGVSRATLVRMVAAGRLVPVQKMPGKSGAYLFDPQHVERARVEREARAS